MGCRGRGRKGGVTVAGTEKMRAVFPETERREGRGKERKERDLPEQCQTASYAPGIYTLGLISEV